MKKLLSILLIILLSTLSYTMNITADTLISGNILYVDDDNTEGPWDGTQEHPYQYVQDAIDNASDGDTVFVFNGTYFGTSPIDRWSPIIVNKTINLTGEDKNSTIIDPMVCGIEIVSDGVNVSGFTIRDCGFWGFAAVYIHSDHNRIYDNSITKNVVQLDYGGIYMYSSSHNLIYRNIISSNNYGIYLDHGSANNTISDNVFSNNGIGIFLDRSSNNNIIANCFLKPLYTIWNHAFFKHCHNRWDANYWERERLLPKPIFGIFGLEFDWNPAQEPYDMP